MTPKDVMMTPPSLTYDILRCIHDYLDIPERRKLEKALGWDIMGIHPLNPSKIDFMEEVMSRRNNEYDYGASFIIPIPPHANPMRKGYEITIPYNSDGWKRNTSTGTWSWFSRNRNPNVFCVVICKLVPYEIYRPRNSSELNTVILMTYRRQAEIVNMKLGFEESFILNRGEDNKEIKTVVAKYTGTWYPLQIIRNWFLHFPATSSNSFF